MKVLITGGAGYIGTELTLALSQHKEISEIGIYDNLSRNCYGFFLHREVTGRKIRFIQGDILDSRKLRSVLTGYDTIIHLAAKTKTPFANVEAHGFEQVNHWGTAELVYALEEIDFRQLIYLSSCAVYGFTEKPASEKTPPNPKTAYSISKYKGEKHINRLMEKSNSRVIILRLGNVFGFSTSMRFDAVINKLLFEAKYNSKIYIEGTGHQKRPFIYINNVVEHLKNVIFSKNISSDTYNLFDQNMRIVEITQIIKSIFPGCEIQYLNQHVQRGSLIFVDSEFPITRQKETEKDIEKNIRKFAKFFPY